LIVGLAEVGGKLKQALEPFLLIELALLEEVGSVPSITPSVVDVKEVVEVKKAEKMTKPKETVIGVQVSKIKDEWGSLIDNLRTKNHSVAGLLRSARPMDVDGDCLDVEVFYQFHKDQLEQEVRRVMVEEGASALWGVRKVRFSLGDSGTRVASKEDEKLVRNAEEVFG